jgi:AMP-activated protein kinase-like protein
MGVATHPIYSVSTMTTVVPVTFRFPMRLGPGVRNVFLVGSFNGWDSAAHRMRRMTDDEWAITVYLPPGRVVYLFSVNGAMWLDPEDEGRPPNGWGSEYFGSSRFRRTGPRGANVLTIPGAVGDRWREDESR